MIAKIKAHTVLHCDVCKQVPTPHVFGRNAGHFVKLSKLPNGSFGFPEAEKGKAIAHWPMVRLAQRIPADTIAVCRSCLLGLNEHVQTSEKPNSLQDVVE